MPHDASSGSSIARAGRDPAVGSSAGEWVGPALLAVLADMGTAAKPLEQYAREGFRWAVVSAHAADPQRALAARGDSVSWVGYYRALERSGTPVAEFRPERWRRLGPWIRVYRIEAPAP